MEFEDLLIHINEMMHSSIQRFKQEAIGRGPQADLTISQLLYVETIFRLGKPSVTELAQALGISKASASAGAHKLIWKGLVKAKRSGDDHRVYYLGLTDKGEKVIEAEKHAVKDFSTRIRQSLNDREVRMLEEIFTKIVNTGTQ